MTSMAPPNSNGDAVVYHHHMSFHENTSRIATTTGATRTNAGRSAYASPTKAGTAQLSAHGTPNTVEESFDFDQEFYQSPPQRQRQQYQPQGTGSGFGGNASTNPFDDDDAFGDGPANTTDDAIMVHDESDGNSELAIAETFSSNLSHVRKKSGGVLGIQPRADGLGEGQHDAVAVAAAAAVSGHHQRNVGYQQQQQQQQVPGGGGGGGFSAAPPPAAPLSSNSPAYSRFDSTASFKSGLPVHTPSSSSAALPSIDSSHDYPSAAGTSASRGTSRAKSPLDKKGGNSSSSNAMPPLTQIKTKPKKKKSNKSQRYEGDGGAEAAVARYYAEEEPFDCGDDGFGGGGGGGVGGDPSSTASHSSAALPMTPTGRAAGGGGGGGGGGSSTFAASPKGSITSRAAAAVAAAQASPRPYDRMYASRSEGAGAGAVGGWDGSIGGGIVANSNTNANANANAATSSPHSIARREIRERNRASIDGGGSSSMRATRGGEPNSGIGAGPPDPNASTNPFEYPFGDSFETAAAANSTYHHHRRRGRSASPNPAAVAVGRTAAAAAAAPATTATTKAATGRSAIRDVPRHPYQSRPTNHTNALTTSNSTRHWQQQRDPTTSSSRPIHSAPSTDSAANRSHASTSSHRAEKAPTATANIHLSVPAATSNASTHVGPIAAVDDAASASTGGTWKRAEEEFAAAEAAARSERASWERGESSWGRTGGSGGANRRDDDDDDGAVISAAAAAAAVSRRPSSGPGAPAGILKPSRAHPWDRKGDGGSTSKRPQHPSSSEGETDLEDDASKKQRAELRAKRERLRAEKKAAASRRRHHGRDGSGTDDEDSTSIGPSLQDRSQEAWKRKKGSGTGIGRSRSAPRPGRGGSVVFTEDTIHHYGNDDEESTVVTKEDSYVSAPKHRSGRGRREDEAYSDDDTYYSRREGTEVAKSYESEVEDLVKDFLFIGRGAKSAPGSKRRASHYKRYDDDDSRSTMDDATYDESTYVTKGTLDDSTYITKGTFDDSATYLTRDSAADRTLESEDTYADVTDDKSKNKSSSSNKKSRNKLPVQKEDDDQTEISADTMKKKSGPCGSSGCEDNPLGVVWELVEGGLDAMTQALGLNSEQQPASAETGASEPTASAKHKPSSSNSQAARASSPTRGITGLVDYANEYMFGESSPAEAKNDATGKSGVDDEAGLVELSLCAAKAKHMTTGVTFDESRDIDVVNEIKFIVITTKLPLGLLFQENSAGCWVAKVFTTGNAANAAVGKGVEVGDQLAAVNGSSTIKLTVDEVCDMISSSSNQDEIELTFLRYVGPLHSKKKSPLKAAASPLLRSRTRSPSPSPVDIRRSTGSGLFGRSSSAPRSKLSAGGASHLAPKQEKKTKKGFLGRSKSKKMETQKKPGPPPVNGFAVPDITQSTSSDFLGEDSKGPQVSDSKKKKKSLFGRKKK